MARQQLALIGAPRRQTWSPQARYIALRCRIHELNRKLDALKGHRMAEITAVETVQIATVKAFGQRFRAQLVEDMGGGMYKMRALEHTGRTSPGTIFFANKNELLTPLTAAAPPNPAASAQALETAMAEERKTLPPVSELLKGARTVPDRPTQRP